MKQYLLFLISLFLLNGVMQAQKHYEHDSTMLLNFLRQPMVAFDGTFNGATNASILVQNYTEGWDTSGEWLDNVRGIEWRNTAKGKQIVAVVFNGLTGGMVAGSLDLSGCDELEFVNCGGQRLDSVNFKNCIYLRNAFINSNNKIRSATFAGCERIDSVIIQNGALRKIDLTGCETMKCIDLYSNQLLPSGIKLPDNTPYHCRIQSQVVDYLNYYSDIRNGLLCVAVDVKNEKYIGSHPVTLKWNVGKDYEKDGLVYFLTDSLVKAGENYWVKCEIATGAGAGAPVNYTADCPVTIIRGLLKVLTEPGRQDMQVSLYLKDTDSLDIKLVGLIPYDDTDKSYWIRALKGNYLVKVAGHVDYLPTFYSDNISVVTDWQKATSISITEDTTYQVKVSLTSESSPIGRIAISIYPSRPDATIRIFTKQGIETAVLGYNNFNEGFYYSDRLPKNDYVVKVEAPGYFPTYYAGDDHIGFVSDKNMAKTISITEDKTYSIKINLFGESEPIARIRVQTIPGNQADIVMLLYQKTGDHEIVLKDTLKYTDQSYYSKYLPKGDYLISAVAAGYLFTYYTISNDPVANWQEATLIPINEMGDDQVTVKITLTGESTLTGNVAISGTLKEADSSAKKTMARPFKNSTVLLQASSKSKSTHVSDLILIKTTQPDEETGAYSFTGVPSGIYYISIEIAGFVSETIEVSAESGQQYGDNNFVISGVAKTVKKEEQVTAAPDLKNVKLTVYPNPVTDVVRINGIEEACVVKVVNVLGQVVASATGTSSELVLDLSSKPSGMYLIRIESQGKTTIRKIIKK